MSQFQHLPKVSRAGLKALVHDIATDPTYSQRVFHYHNNRNNELMGEAVVAANKQADGDIKRQESFMKGVEFALAAMQRQIDSDRLEAKWGEGEPIELLIESPPNVA